VVKNDVSGRKEDEKEKKIGRVAATGVHAILARFAPFVQTRAVKMGSWKKYENRSPPEYTTKRILCAGKVTMNPRQSLLLVAMIRASSIDNESKDIPHPDVCQVTANVEMARQPTTTKGAKNKLNIPGQVFKFRAHCPLNGYRCGVPKRVRYLFICYHGAAIVAAYENNSACLTLASLQGN
jgi:hypothetical protein